MLFVQIMYVENNIKSDHKRRPIQVGFLLTLFSVKVPPVVFLCKTAMKVLSL